MNCCCHQKTKHRSPEEQKSLVNRLSRIEGQVRGLRDMLQIGKAYGASWYCAGAVTKKGHPHHPLYLKKDEPLKPFDIENYLRTL